MRHLALLILLALFVSSCSPSASLHTLRKQGVNYYVKAKNGKPYTGKWHEYEGKVLIAEGVMEEGSQVERKDYHRTGELKRKTVYR